MITLMSLYSRTNNIIYIHLLSCFRPSAGSGLTMSGAYSKPMPWSGGGSTKPPLANNYLDSHGLNPGLGNAGHANFPSVVTAAPTQAARMANYTR